MKFWARQVEKIEDYLFEGYRLTWLKAYIQSSGITLVSISVIWILLELLIKGERTESAIDTIIALIAAVAVGVCYAHFIVKKEENNALLQTIAKQNDVLKEQTTTIQKVWQMKKQGH